jgi:hypothetical protein
MQYEFHEAANEFPMMSADRFIDLKNEIGDEDRGIIDLAKNCLHDWG